MSKLKIVNLAFLATLYLNLVKATPEVHQENLSYPDRRVIFSPYYYKNKELVYALCEKTFQAYENHCTVIRRNNVIQNETLSCNITIKNEQEDGHLGPTYEVLPLGTNKVIFISAEIGDDTFVKLRTIQMENCQVTETKFHLDFPYEIALYYVVPQGDSFLVMFENKAQCGNKMCVVSADSSGGSIKNLPHISKSMKPLPSPIVAPSGTSASGKNLFFIKSGPKDSKNLVLRKPNGQEKSISKQTFTPRMTILSTTNDLIGVCHDTLAGKTKIVCTQHDTNGQLKFEFESENLYEQLKLRAMYNAAGGGILMIVDCTDGILVLKIDAQGKFVGQFNIDDFDCPRAFATAASIFELENKGHCASMVCREGNDFYIVDQSYLNLVTDCFTDADFTS